MFRFVHLLDQYSVENNNKIVIKTTVQITYPVENTLYTTISISSKKFLAFSPRVLSEANISLLGDQNRGLECEGTEKKIITVGSTCENTEDTMGSQKLEFGSTCWNRKAQFGMYSTSGNVCRNSFHQLIHLAC